MRSFVVLVLCLAAVGAGFAAGPLAFAGGGW